MKTQNTFSKVLQDYFLKRLIQQQNVSDKTIKSYRDTFKLLFIFAQIKFNIKISNLTLEHLDANFISKFLNYLENDRKNTVRTRNTRFAAIRSFLQYAIHQDPSALPTINKVLAIPMKKHDKPLIGFITRKEIEEIIDAPDLSTWSGKRDQVMFATLYNTGARVSEIAALRQSDVDLNHKMVIHLHGKGRKERIIPLWKNTVTLLKKWLCEIKNDPFGPLFPNNFGMFITRSGVENRLKAATKIAALKYPALKKKKITPHIIHHTTAMHLLQSGVDLAVIALWLGHENITTTHHYIEADLKMKKEALKVIQEPCFKKTKKIIDNKLLSFLEGL